LSSAGRSNNDGHDEGYYNGYQSSSGGGYSRGNGEGRVDRDAAGAAAGDSALAVSRGLVAPKQQSQYLSPLRQPHENRIEHFRNLLREQLFSLGQ
jgi:hypothetical protein